METKLLFVFISLNIFAVVLADQLVPDGFIMSSTSCAVDDFSPTCTLECAINQEGAYWNSNDLLVYKWIYYATVPDVNVTMFDNSYFFGNFSENYTISLTLSEYYAGCYRCYFAFDDYNGGNIIAYQDFKIDDAVNGSFINHECEKNSDCLALNAVCGSDKNCTCVSPNDISFNQELDTPACLSHKNLMDNCSSDGECYKPDEYRFCVSEECQCSGVLYKPSIISPVICYQHMPAMAECQVDENCYVPNIQNIQYAYCEIDTGTCQCTEEATLSANLMHCKATNLTMQFDSCTKDDFDGDNLCNLTCSVDVTNIPYTFSNHYWTYTVHSGFTFTANLFDSILSIDGDHYETVLPLQNYSSGFYVCHLQFVDEKGNITDMSRAFNVSQQTGAYMGDECTDDGNCATLNARCDEHNSTCLCEGYFNLEYNLYPDTPACLQHVGYGDPCTSDVQCANDPEKFLCTNQVCTCNATWMTVSGVQKCLEKAPLTGLCSYDKQCLLVTANSACQDRGCTCASGYEMDTTKTFCQSTLSGGAIAGIVIGSVAGAAIILSAIVFFVTRGRK